MEQTDLAYIAGILDGEGHIGIKKTVTRRNGRINPQYQERIAVRMVDEPAIRFIAETLGGNYYSERPHAHNGRPLYCFQATDRQAASMLEAVLPYLRVKRQNALAVLELRKRKERPDRIAVERQWIDQWGRNTVFTRWLHSPNEIAARESLYELCKALNHAPI